MCVAAPALKSVMTGWDIAVTLMSLSDICWLAVMACVAPRMGSVRVESINLKCFVPSLLVAPTVYRHEIPQGVVSDENAYAMGGISGHAGTTHVPALGCGWAVHRSCGCVVRAQSCAATLTIDCARDLAARNCVDISPCRFNPCHFAHAQTHPPPPFSPRLRARSLFDRH